MHKRRHHQCLLPFSGRADRTLSQERRLRRLHTRVVSAPSASWSERWYWKFTRLWWLAYIWRLGIMSTNSCSALAQAT